MGYQNRRGEHPLRGKNMHEPCQAHAGVRQEDWLTLMCQGQGRPVHVTFHLGSAPVTRESTQVPRLLLQGSFCLAFRSFLDSLQALGWESAGIVRDEGTRVSGADTAEDTLELAGPVDMPALPILFSLSLTRAFTDHQARPHRGLLSHCL